MKALGPPHVYKGWSPVSPPRRVLRQLVTSVRAVAIGLRSESLRASVFVDKLRRQVRLTLGRWRG